MIDESAKPTSYPSERRRQRYALGLFATEGGVPVADFFPSGQLPCSPTNSCGNECVESAKFLRCDADDSVNELLYSEAGYTSSLPEELGFLSALTKVDIGGNLFNPGTLPPELGAWTNVISLNFSDTGLTIIPAWAASLTKLNELDISHNCFSTPGREGGTFPATFSSLTSLTSLIADNACLAEQFPMVLLAMRSLQQLCLDTNKIR